MRPRVGAICPVCAKPVTEKTGILLARVRVCSKPRTYLGVTTSTFQLQPSHSSIDRREVFMPRYLVHETCLTLPAPTKEFMYELEERSRTDVT